MAIERGSDKHSPLMDDALSGEVEGLVRSGHSTHAEEWKDPEPAGEDQPGEGLSPDAPLHGGTPEGMDDVDVERRSELAQFLGKEVWPAGKDRLLAVAEERQAPDRVIDELERLPADREFENVSQVWQELGGGTEQHRF